MILNLEHPKDWDVVPLSEACSFQEGPGLRNWQFKENGIKVINITNLVNGYLDLSKTSRYLSWEEFRSQYLHFEVDEVDILMASSGNSYCKVAEVRDFDLPLVMNTSVIRFKEKLAIRDFLLQLLKADFFKETVDFLITGSAQPNFGPYHLNRMKVALPPKKQQQKIAKILTTVDNLIEKTQALIDKYTAIKQGMMADLFTRGIDLSGTPETNPNHGQLRPPFEQAPELYKQTELGWIPKEWEVAQLMELLEGKTCPSGIYKEKELYGSGLNILKISEVFKYDIYQSEEINRVPLSEAEYERNKICEGDILIAIASVKLEGVGKVMYVSSLIEKTAFDHNVSLIRTDSNQDSKFIFYFLQSHQIRKQIRQNCTQVGTIFLKSSSIMRFLVPEISNAEQKAISSKIIQMEKTISSHFSDLNKYKVLKKGLMQDLLTGRVQV